MCRQGISKEFKVDVGLRQVTGECPNPTVIHCSSGGDQQDSEYKGHSPQVADDLAVVADSEADLQERLIDLKEIFDKHGLSVSLEKMEVLWVGQQKKDLDIKLDGKKLNQRDSFVYLGGAVCGDGSTETEIRRRVQAGASALRKVEGVMGDRHICQKLNGKVLNSCITPAYLNGLETKAMTKKQQEKLQVCENKWVRRIAGVKRIDKRRMEELREEVGGKESFTRKLVGKRVSQGSWWKREFHKNASQRS